MRMTLGAICIFFLAGTALSEPAGLTLATKGRSEYVIVVGKDAPANEQYAARELAHFLGKVTGANFKVRSVGKAGAGAKIAVGPAAALKLDPKINLKGLGADGIVIQTRPPHLILTGGPGEPRGTLYAVYTFLEDVVGCRWWTPKVSKIPVKETLKIPSLNVRYVPVLEYRRTSYARDSDWAVRNKENGCGIDKKRGGRIAWKGWVHTFGRLVPPEKHFKEHPEWFAQVNGKRVSNGQLCLTNKQMQAFLIKQVKKWLDESPAARIISVSQNDNSPHCQCPRCRGVELAEGNRPSGPILQFVNAVAEAIEKDHPNVLVSTLAYLYSQRPPRITKPRHNVIVRLCSHRCSFAHTLTHVKNRTFHDDIVGWSKICNHLYIWDYVTNFEYFLLPHPNLRVLGPNLRFFVKHGVKGIYEQGNGRPGGELRELRGWVLTKLMWNPQADEKKLIKEFLTGYYEKAAPFIEKYLDLIHDEVERKDFFMRCYVSPHSAPFLTPSVILAAERLFQEAELAVADKPDVLERVKVAHMSVLYVAVIRWPEMREAARQSEQAWPFPATREEAVSRFERFCSKHKVTRLGEWGSWKRVGWLRERYGK